MSEQVCMVLRCKVCDSSQWVRFEIDQYDRWQNGEFIQDAMPHLTVAERELLISKICGDCFDQMYKGHEDE